MADRRGAALPLVLLAMLALTGLAHGLLGLARQEMLVSRSAARLLQARLAAEAGMRITGGSSLAGPAGPALPATGAVGPSGHWTVAARRTGAETWLVESTGAVPPSPLQRRTARVAWVLDPVVRVGAIGAVLEHGGGVVFGPGAVVDGSRIGRPPEGWPDACDGWRAVVDSLYPHGTLSPEGPPPPAPAATPSFRWAAPHGPRPHLGLLDLDSLAARSDGDASVTVARGDHHLEDTDVRGVLIVEGALSLGESAGFTGLALVGGDLELGPGAALTGLVRAGGAARLAAGARIDGSACAALTALDATAGLRRPLWIDGGEWLEPP